MGIFRYNAKVDTETEIYLNKHRNNKEALLRDFRNIPYDGSGIYTVVTHVSCDSVERVYMQLLYLDRH